jgi:tetratricopeptide (TPR) repeat protein
VRIVGDWQRDRPVRQHLVAGMEYVKQGLGPQAAAEWKEALRLDPNNALAYEGLAEYYFSARAWEKAAGALERLVTVAPQEAHVQCRLAACYLNMGDEVSAFRHSEAEIRRDPNCVPALATSAILLNRMNEKPRAITYLRRLAHLEPDDLALQYMLAEALGDTYAYREARPVLEHVIHLDPTHSDAYAQLGIGWVDDPSAPDHLQRAEQALRKSLALNPLNSEARLSLGRLYLLQNQPRAAIPQLEEATRLMPQSSRPPFELARAYDLAGEPSQAAAMLRQFVSLRHTYSRISALQKRCSVNPTVFDYPYELGMLELGQGEYRKAYVFLHKALALRPHDRRVASALDELSRRTPGPARMMAVEDRISQSSGVQAFRRSGVRAGKVKD